MFHADPCNLNGTYMTHFINTDRKACSNDSKNSYYYFSPETRENTYANSWSHELVSKTL